MKNITRNYLRQHYKYIISVPYCKLQNALRYYTPIGSNCGKYGFNYTVYEIKPDTVIVTGYRPFGEPMSEEVIHFVNEAAFRLEHGFDDMTSRRWAIIQLLLTLVREFKEKKGGCYYGKEN